MNRRDRPIQPPTRGLLWLLCVAVAAVVACSDTEPTGNPGDTGVDVSGCPGSQTLCGDQCVDLSTDPQHCGTCTSVCDSTEMCVDSACTCPDGFDRCGVACRDTQNDPQHCGGCGLACGTDEDCVDGTCALRCGTGLTACLDGCVDTTVSDDHCGGCDQPCVASENEVAACEDGTCARGCRDGWYDLDGSLGCEYFCDPDVPGDEICDGQDNDCDGQIDDADPDYVAVLCPRQDGVCNGAVAACVDGALVDCDAAVYDAADPDAPYSESFEQWCDGLDNDCSGLADEDCCAASDMPLALQLGALPGGVSEVALFATTALEGAPTPMFAATIVATIDGEQETLVSLLHSQQEGGGLTVDVVDSGPYPGGPALEAVVWNEAPVFYVRDETDGTLERRVLSSSGETVASHVVNEAALGGNIRQARLRAAGEGVELGVLLVRPDGGSAERTIVAQIDNGAVVRSVEVAGLRSNVGLVDVVSVGDRIIACTSDSSRERPIECSTVSAEWVHTRTDSFDAFVVPLVATRFLAQPDGSHVLHAGDPVEEVVVTIAISPSGELTLTPTTARAPDGIVVSGSLPDGSVGLLTVDDVTSEEPVFRLSVPSDGNSIIAQYRTDTPPYALARTGDLSYVVFPSPDYARTPVAYPISRDNAALCVE